MQNRTAALIITIATALICGCAAILTFVFGILGATNTPFTNSINGVPTGSAPMPVSLGYALICTSVIFVAIPVVVGFFTLRKKPTPPDTTEPLPPAA